MQFLRAVCVDGPLVGAQVSFPAGERRVTVHGPAGEAEYELGELLGPLPGALYAARHVPATTAK